MNAAVYAAIKLADEQTAAMEQTDAANIVVAWHRQVSMVGRMSIALAELRRENARLTEENHTLFRIAYPNRKSA